MRYRHCSAPRPARQRGAALVVSLLVFAISAALIVAMKGDFDRLYARGSNIFVAEQGLAYLRGAEELAGIALILDHDQDARREVPRDDLDEIWAQPSPPYPLDDGGVLEGALEDLQGRFNLNRLLPRQQQDREPNTPRFTAGQAQFIRLLQALGEPQVSESEAVAITEAVGDWLDADNNPALDGAEDDEYYARTPSYRAANRPMASVSELRAVAGMTPEIYQALLPWVTVWPRDPEPLNIHTAPAMVLRSINVDDELMPLSEADGEALENYRRESGFSDTADFLEQPMFSGREEEMSATRALLGETSSWFLLSARVEVADREMRLYSVLQRANRQVTAVARASGSL